MVKCLKRYFLKPVRSEGGNVIILVGLMFFLLIIAVGVAVDMAREQILQQRISASLDAAGLAAMQTISSPDPSFTGSTAQWATQEAQRYFNANFPTGYLQSNPIIVNAAPSTDKNTIVLNAATTQQTTFMQTFGVGTMSVSAASTVTRNSTETLEVVLVLDNTGSMALPVNPANSPTPKLQALQTAASELLDILFGVGNPTAPGLNVGVVPFTQAVNIGESNSNWVAPNTYNWGTGANGVWAGCVETRDLTDLTPAQLPFQAYYFPAATPYYQDSDYAAGGQYSCYYTDPDSAACGNATTWADANGYVNFNPWWKGDAQTNFAYTVNAAPDNTNVPPTTPFPTTDGASNAGYTEVSAQESILSQTSQGPNRFCPQAVLPMSPNKSDVLGNINSMVAVGDTNLDIGMSWGFRMLSPNWRGTWGGNMAANSLPQDYNTPGNEKVVILMTDGMNHYGYGNYTAYNFLTNTTLMTPPADATPAAAAAGIAAATVQLDTNTKNVCDAMKGNNIIIYTIGFGTNDNDDPTDPTSVNGPLLEYCATQNFPGDTSHYFLAPTNAQLQADFQAIGKSIETIRVSK